MTKISYMAHVPADEYRDRGKMMGADDYIPFTQIAEWQTRLAILRNHAKHLAAWGQDQSYLRASDMLTDAMQRGTYRNTGVRSNAEAWAHSAIQAIMPQSGIGALIAIEAPDIRTNRAFVAKYRSLLWSAGYTEYIQRAESQSGYSQKYWANKLFEDKRFGELDRDKMRAAYEGLEAKYQDLVKVESIINAHLPNASHHVLYFSLDEKLTYPTRVDVKRILHDSGVSAIATMADVEASTAKLWTATSIKNKNMANGAGTLGPVESSFAIAPNGDQLLAEYQKRISGAAVGIAPAVALAIISLIAAAVTAAQVIYVESQKTKQLALTNVKGFGTPALSAEKTDWNAVASGGTGGGGLLGNPIALLAGGFLLYTLMDESK